MNKKMKLLFLISVFVLTGCGQFYRSVTAWTGDFTYKCSKSGVEYVQSDSGIAVHVDMNGKPIKCR